MVDLDNLRADPVEKVTVVRDHQQRQFRPREILFQPACHLQVEMVCRLVEDQQVRFRNQRIGQRDPFGLAAREIFCLLVESGDVQPRENLLDP